MVYVLRGSKPALLTLRQCVFALCVALMCAATGARADEAPAPPAVSLRLTFSADKIGVPDKGYRYLDVLTSTLDADLQRAAGWRGAVLHVDVIHTYSQGPNELVRSAQGVDDHDGRSRLVRLYQAWLDQGFADGRASLLTGIFDLKREFAVLDSAEVLINPSFSVAPELSKSGPTGAPVYPSTALGARLRLRHGERGYLQVAAVNARAGTVGDIGGLDTSFDDGLLVIGEAGVTGRRKLALGVWRHTEDQPGLRRRTGTGAVDLRTSHGAYVMAEAPLGSAGEGREARLFVRAGVSDGHTTPYRGSWQAGVTVRQVYEGRPESVLALGVTQAVMSRGFILNQARTARPAPIETTFEVTYSDRISRHLAIQPDVQWVHHPARAGDARTACVFIMRATISL